MFFSHHVTSGCFGTDTVFLSVVMSGSLRGVWWLFNKGPDQFKLILASCGLCVSISLIMSYIHILCSDYMTDAIT